jgi:hypothetical protein
MKRLEPLSTFDRMGVGLVSILGTCIGLMVGLASDLRLTPVVALLFPGFLAGMIASRLFGITSAVLACGVSNGASYGFLLYGWCRLAEALRQRIPSWFAALANSLAHGGRRQ